MLESPGSPSLPASPGSGKPNSGSKARRSGVVVPQQANFSGRMAAGAVYGLIRLVDASLRYRLEDPWNSMKVVLDKPVIFVIWHNRLALSVMLYHRFVLSPQPARHMAGLVSASRDGGLLARVLEHFQVQPVRGSSSRRGAQAILEMTSWAERGYDLAITPDGPRGPRYSVQAGAIAAAQLTGLQLVPVSFEVPWKIQLKSWDRFQIPVPGSRCVVRLHQPLSVPRELGDEHREALRVEVERRMKEITVD